jgi:nucleotide-binding universal stress UspA family protein
MYRKILFGIDPAGTALGATPVVAAIAGRFAAEVIALEIMELDHDYDYAYDSDAEPAALAYEVARDLQRLGVSATAEVRELGHGHVGKEIARVADEVAADLVALGSRGRSDFMGLLAGSVGHEVAANSKRAVLLVRASNEPAALATAALQPQIRNVLVGVDGSERSAEAVGAAIDVATAWGARVIAAHVREYAFGSEVVPYIEPNEVAQAVLAAAADRCREAGVAAEVRALPGLAGVARELVALADEVNADLIVLGPRRLGDLGGLLLGSVAHQVLHLTRRPLLMAERLQAAANVR